MSLILIDGSALVYRSHYAFANRPLTAPSGETTSIIFGFANTLLRLIETRRPTHLAVIFDKKGKVFRHDIYKEYKAQRKPMPEEMVEQLPRLRELLDLWGLNVLEEDGFEADDLIATLCRESRGTIDPAWIYSGDKDFLQLVDDHVQLLKPGRRGDELSEIGPREVIKEFGLTPPELIDVFALSGDSSDNIPGAPGIGPKTALKLIRENGSLDQLLGGLESADLTPRLRRVLDENREQILMSRVLFRIRDDVPMDYDWDALSVRLPDNPEARELLQSLGLRQVLAMLDRVARRMAAAPLKSAPDTGEDSGDAEVEPSAVRWNLAARGYRRLEDEISVAAYLKALPAGAPLAVDTETDSLRTDIAKLVGVSLSSAAGEGVYIPVIERKDAAQGDLFAVPDPEDRLKWLRPLLGPVLADPQRLKIGQNLKFDAWILSRHGLPIVGPIFDTMLAAYVLDPGRDGLGMDDMCRQLLALDPIPYKALFGEKDREKNILAVEPERLAVYAAEDADYTFRLYEYFQPRLADEKDLSALFEDLELPLSEVLLRTEQNGIRVDAEFLLDLGRRFGEQMTVLEEKAQAQAGREFNLKSPKQLATVLFEDLGLKPLKKTASGWSTDSSVLEALSDAHQLPATILEHRQLAKLRGTYVESLVDLINPDTGLLHTTYNQAVAATGRLSSSDPNLQNIPIRSENGRLIRKAFVVREPGNVFLSADYSQVELRLLAHLSGDEALCETFNSGGDVHRRTAALIAGVDEEAVDSGMRYRAKAINFGVIYGMGARALAKQIDVKVRVANQFIDSYFRTYPGVRAFIDEAKDKARRTGMSTTLLGRRRLLPDIASDNPRIRAFAERAAVNTPIQGTAADLIKLAMLNVDRRLRAQNSPAMILLQVHDELLLELPESVLPETRELVREEMETVMDLSVPLLVDMHTGIDWAAAHD